MAVRYITVTPVTNLFKPATRAFGNVAIVGGTDADATGPRGEGPDERGTAAKGHRMEAEAEPHGGNSEETPSRWSEGLPRGQPPESCRTPRYPV